VIIIGGGIGRLTLASPLLADSLAYDASIPEALQTDARLRIPRTSRIVEQPLRFGRMG
jgi:hypothetical protein